MECKTFIGILLSWRYRHLRPVQWVGLYTDATCVTPSRRSLFPIHRGKSGTLTHCVSATDSKGLRLFTVRLSFSPSRSPLFWHPPTAKSLLLAGTQHLDELMESGILSPLKGTYRRHGRDHSGATYNPLVFGTGLLQLCPIFKLRLGTHPPILHTVFMLTEMDG